jgi:hypothetical protein
MPLFNRFHIVQYACIQQVPLCTVYLYPKGSTWYIMPILNRFQICSVCLFPTGSTLYNMPLSNRFHIVQYTYIQQVPLCTVCLYPTGSTLYSMPILNRFQICLVCLYPTVSTLYSMPILNRFHYVQYACIQQFPHYPERQDHIHEEFYGLYAYRLPLTRLFLVL